VYSLTQDEILAQADKAEDGNDWQGYAAAPSAVQKTATAHLDDDGCFLAPVGFNYLDLPT